MYIDIDHFKQINDTYGHQSGDEVLREVASRIKIELRLSDTLGRFGGEEFVALLPDTHEEDAFHVAERIRVGISDKPFIRREKAAGDGIDRRRHAGRRRHRIKPPKRPGSA